MNRWWAVAAVVMLAGAHAPAQDIVGDVLAGNLVKPKPGVWAWYDVGDPASGNTLMLRLAIVGEEKVQDKTGYWLEIEVVPPVGYKSVYKMLVTGPANDPRNVHKMFQREGAEPAKEVPVPTGPQADTPKAKTDGAKKLVGEEEVEAAGAKMKASHYEIVQEGKQVDVWLSEAISPMGIVRMKSPASGMVLRAHGEGGEGARSVLDDDETPKGSKESEAVKVQVQVEKAPEAKKPKKGSAKK